MMIDDDLERQAAAEIEQSQPRWMVMWGCYSRLFWAFPCFLVPKGTIVSAPDRVRLLADMERVEAEASADSQVSAHEPARPAARLPVRRPPARPTPLRQTPPLRPIPGQAQRGALPMATAPVGASGWQAQLERANYDPYVSGPFRPGRYSDGLDDSDRYSDGLDDDADRYDFGPDGSHASWQRLWPAALNSGPFRCVASSGGAADSINTFWPARGALRADSPEASLGPC